MTETAQPQIVKTFTPIEQFPIGNKPGQTPIGKCSGILENHMQCWRAGDVVVASVIPAYTTLEGTEVPEHVSTAQFCRYHANIEKASYDGRMAQSAEQQPALSETAPESAPQAIVGESVATTPAPTVAPPANQAPAVKTPV